MAGLFLFYLTFEYLVVSQLPMMTEVVPASRATAIALNSVGFGIGRSLGALISTFVYARFGFAIITILAIGFNLLALWGLAEMEQRTSVLPRVLTWLRKAAGAR
jgi:predicted MFS family arabinose efflux permease